MRLKIGLAIAMIISATVAAVEVYTIVTHSLFPIYFEGKKNPSERSLEKSSPNPEIRCLEKTKNGPRIQKDSGAFSTQITYIKRIICSYRVIVILNFN